MKLEEKGISVRTGWWIVDSQVQEAGNTARLPEGWAACLAIGWNFR